MAAAIQANALKKWFGDGDARTMAIRDASFTANYGEVLFLAGPSGSGKTTLLSIVSGILRPDEGEVFIAGTSIWTLDDNQLADFRLNKLGFVIQDFHLFPRLVPGAARW